jgi:hypothetical protein
MFYGNVFFFAKLSIGSEARSSTLLVHKALQLLNIPTPISTICAPQAGFSI